MIAYRLPDQTYGRRHLAKIAAGEVVIGEFKVSCVPEITWPRLRIVASLVGAALWKPPKPA